ncbi:CHAT domain-containing protein [Paractinoplanes durhamensis]|uniref:CHAT domain-containing protein n=1 Tax=Paractinoplanes durhamensis TaxID=113563 RepID=A0ABQ3Z529_9ACTN|nr:CHAT domain-containing protein [Actinoplanes durhamensis]GIE04938.1 CHAT domain-containing protein [Actinoplanes durhamensis]
MELDDLTEALAEIAAEFVRSGDPDVLLSGDTLALAQRSLELIGAQQAESGVVAIEPVYVLAWLHWHRSLAAGEQGADDFDQAFALFAALWPVVPDAVPDEVRSQLEAAQRPSDRAADLVEAYERTGRLGLLNEAVDVLSGLATGEPPQTLVLLNLGYALRLRYERTRRADDLRDAIAFARRAVDAQADAPAEPALALSQLATALNIRYDLTGDIADLDEAIQLLRDALAASAADSADVSLFATNLGLALLDRFRRTGRLDDLNDAVQIAELAVERCPPNDSHRSPALANLGVALHARFETTGDRRDLTAAIDAAEQAVGLLGAEDPYLPMRLANLAVCLHAASKFGEQGPILDQAIRRARRAVDMISADHPQRPGIMGSLASMLMSRFVAGQDRADLDESVRLNREAVDEAADDRTRARYLSNLAGVLQERHRWTGDGRDLDAAVAAAQQSVEVTSGEAADRRGRLASLGIVLMRRFQQFGDRSDLDAAIAATEQAVEGMPLAAPESALHRTNLGSLYIERFDLTADPADLARGVRNHQESVDRTPPGHVARSLRLSMFSLALARRAELTGDGGDFDASIEMARTAVDTVEPGITDALGARANYATVLRRRYVWTGQRADLDAAIASLGKAIEESPSGHPERAVLRSIRSTLHGDRFELSGNRSDLDQAVADSRESFTATPPGHSAWAGRAGSLGVMLRLRFAVTGERADIDEAVEFSRAADAAAPDATWDRARSLTNLGSALRARYEAFGDLGDIDAAIEVTEQAVPMSADGAARARVLSHLGRALQSRHRKTGQADDLRTAVECQRSAAGIVTSPVQHRIIAALAWGRMAFEAGEQESALDGFALAVDLLPQAAWHGLDEVTRREQLAELQGLAAIAASCAIAAGRPDRAVELLEQGRSIIWSHALHLRSEPALLADRAPELAERLRRLRHELGAAPLDDLEPAGAFADRRRRAARELDDLLGDIRRLDGFEHFFRTTPLDQLRVAAAEGPVVLLNTSELGSHALIVGRETVEVVPLPDAAPAEALARIDAFLTVIGRDGERQRGFLARERDRHAVFDLLDWLWTAVAEPVFGALGWTGGPVKRLWWCPTGLWTVFPIHAAGRHPRNRNSDPDPVRTVAGRAISSYTPTLAALVRARAEAVPDAMARMLAVGVAAAPGMPDLPAVDQELAAVRRYFAEPEHGRELRGDAATGAAVKQLLPDSRWVHFACHGHQDPADPSRSALWLADGPLTVDDLVRLRHDRAEFAFLSACQTATGDIRVLDEAVHLAAAFRLLGFRHVIAGLWHIRDAPAPEIADAVYSRLTVTGAADAGPAALALHEAVAQLRSKYPDRPLVWAPYTHSGP